MRLRHLFIFCFLFCVAVPLCSAAERTDGKRVPTSIRADHMDYDADKQTVVFGGNVYVKRPDFELWSAKLVVYLDKAGKKSEDAENGGAVGMQAGNVDRIVAEKDVRMKSNDKEGTCQKATYYAKTDKVVMEGNPVLKNNKDQSTMKGSVITHYLKANRSEVQRPEATFFTQDKTENSLSPGDKPKGNNR